MRLGAARALLASLLKLLFRVRIDGLEYYPRDERRVLIVANHVSSLDSVLLSVLLPETPRFVIPSMLGQGWWRRLFLRLIPHIRTDPGHPLFLQTLSRHLDNGERVAIFPEGRISVTGALMKVYAGAALAADKTGALILPVHIEGAQYSLFSGAQGKPGRHLLPRIQLTLLPPRRLEAPATLDVQARRRRLERLLDDLMVELEYAGTRLERTLFEALLDARRQHGGRRFIVADNRTSALSYRQLLLRSFVLAVLLRKNSIGQRCAGLLLPNSVVALNTFLALHINGCTPAVLDTSAGPTALLNACRTADLKTVYTSQAFVKSAKLERVIARLSRWFDVVFLEDLADHISLGDRLSGLGDYLFARRAYHRLAGPVSADAPALVLFTAAEGSPEGVVFSHRNLLASYAQIKATLDITPRDTVLNALPFCHAFGLLAGTLVSLLHGMKVFLYPSALQYHVIPTLAYKHCASVLIGAGPFLAGYAQHANPYDFFSLRLVLAGAERLNPALRRLWIDKFGIRVIEVYGAAHASPVLALNSPRRYRPDTAGRLAPGVEHYLEPAAKPDQGGRLCVRGPGVATAYLNPQHPGQLLPRHTDRGTGWCDTGDTASIDAEGFVEIKEQNKRIAEIGGETVSLSSLESLAGSLWPQEQHAAITLPDQNKGEQLVLLTTRYNASRAELLKAAREQGVGEIHVPRQVIVVNELPVLGSGKLNDSAVRRLAQALLAAHPRTLH